MIARRGSLLVRFPGELTSLVTAIGKGALGTVLGGWERAEPELERLEGNFQARRYQLGHAQSFIRVGRGLGAQRQARHRVQSIFA
jgi:hypothetical protein